MSTHDHPEYPEGPNVEPARPRTPPTAWVSPGGRLTVMLWLLIGLVSLLILPSIAERVQYALTRGYERARADVSKKLLAQLPEAEARYPHVVRSVMPSVVGIETVRLAQGQWVRDEQFHLFRVPRELAAGQGSGVIVDEAGYILTNFHVVDQATEVTVRFSDRSPAHSATVVGADPLTDLAVLKIDTQGLTAVSWGDSDELEVGDQVLAVGNPYGLSRTVTAGIISATERQATLPNRSNQDLLRLPHQEFLQTDAAVNPGNSGGPLVNLKGELVGINTAIYGQSYSGISFAIPSTLARDIYERLKTTGKVDRGWLGIEMLETSEDVARQLEWQERKGVLVRTVISDSPAEKAGLEPGDIIVKWNEQEIRDPSELSLAVVRTKIGSKATVEVVRDGKKLEFTVRVGRRPVQLQE